MSHMLQDQNPYRPGAGLMPPELAGRSTEIAAFDMLRTRAKRREIDRGLALSGLRGVGKTALLNHLMLMADQDRWISIALEAQSTAAGEQAVRRRLGALLQAALAKFSLSRRLRTGLDSLRAAVGEFSLAAGGISVTATTPAATGLLDLDIEKLTQEVAQVAQQHQTAFAIFIDEMQDLDSEVLAALLVAQHRCQQLSLPFYVIGAGLPNLPARLTEARSYAERLFLYSAIGPLSRPDASMALTRPAERAGCSFTPEALTRLIDASAGYPYFLQEFGKAIWTVATSSDFSDDDADRAVQIGVAQLDAGFFPSRWDRATDRERQYMAAMADLTPPILSRSLAEALGSDLSHLSGTRHALIAKGLVYAPARGEIAFTVPMMADFIRRQTDRE